MMPDRWSLQACAAHQGAVEDLRERLASVEADVKQVPGLVFAGDQAVRTELLTVLHDVQGDIKQLLGLPRPPTGHHRRSSDNGLSRHWPMIALGAVGAGAIAGSILGAAAGREGVAWAVGIAGAVIAGLAKLRGGG